MSDKDVMNEVRSCGEYVALLKQLYVLFKSAYSFKGLPHTINQKYLWNQLLKRGSVAFFKDPVIGLLVLDGTPTGSTDMYGVNQRISINGNAFTASRKNYRSVLNKDIDGEDLALVMYNDDEQSIPSQRLKDFADRIFNCERTSDMNVVAQRTPIFMEVPEGEDLTIKNLYGQFKSWKPVIFSRKKKSLDNNPVKVLKTDAPSVFMDVDDYKKRLWHEVLSYIGIESNVSEKSERLIKGEVLVSNGLAIAQKQARLTELNETLDMLKVIFPELVDVEVVVNNISMLDLDGDMYDGEIDDDNDDDANDDVKEGGADG